MREEHLELNMGLPCMGNATVSSSWGSRTVSSEAESCCFQPLVGEKVKVNEWGERK